MAGRRRQLVGGIVLGGLVVAAVATGIGIWRTPTIGPGEYATSAVLLVLTGALALAVLRLVPRGDRPGIQVDPDDLVRHWPTVSLVLAVAFTVALFGPFPVSQAARWWGLSLPLSVGWFGEVALLPASLVGAAWLARRRRPAAAVIVTAFGLHAAFVPIATRLGFPMSNESTLFAVLAAALAALVFLVVTRRLSADRALAIATVLLVGSVFPFREYLDEPFSVLATVSNTTAGLLLGMAWRQLTEYGFTRRESPGFPAAARVLLGTANLTLVASAVAMHALAAGSGVMSLGLIENVGDEVMGTSLLYAVAVAGLLLGVRGREGGDAAAGEEFQLFPLLVERKGPLLDDDFLAGGPTAPGSPGGAPWPDRGVDLDAGVGKTRWR